MTDPRRAATTPVDPDSASFEPEPADRNPEPDTHTAALQGAAGGGMGGATSAGYAGGLFTGSEDGIGIREIPDEDEPDGTVADADADAGIDADAAQLDR